MAQDHAQVAQSGTQGTIAQRTAQNLRASVQGLSSYPVSPEVLAAVEARLPAFASAEPQAGAVKPAANMPSHPRVAPSPGAKGQSADLMHSSAFDEIERENAAGATLYRVMAAESTLPSCCDLVGACCG